VGMTSWGPTLTVPVDADRDHVRGPVDAPVTLVEYGDFQCPFCGAAHPVVESVRATMGDDLQFVFRHFPLTTMHPNAEPAAEAAEAAGSQGRFWPMHDSLFLHQDRLAAPDLVARAHALHLDVDRFTAELADRSHAGRVREDFLGGVRSGVNGTPTFFVNGIRYDGPVDLPGLLDAAQRARATA
jgi:Na+:H+ antiporter, NhaA family